MAGVFAKALKNKISTMNSALKDKICTGKQNFHQNIDKIQKFGHEAKDSAKMKFAKIVLKPRKEGFYGAVSVLSLGISVYQVWKDIDVPLLERMVELSKQQKSMSQKIVDIPIETAKEVVKLTRTPQMRLPFGNRYSTRF